MKRAFAVLLSLFAALTVLGACSDEKPVTSREPFALTEEAMGRYCGMNVLEHAGPKGQVILTGALEPIWFSSARDTIAFTMLPEEPKDIAGIYVSDMAVAASWESPGADNWIDARQAFYVLRSTRQSGMGVAEAVPFSTEAAARTFIAAYGGDMVRFAEIPVDYVLGGGGPQPSQTDGKAGN
jgi:copper chaperone NosL